MPRRAPGQLTALKASRAKPGRYGDGGGLWLDVSPSGARSWTFRYTSPVTGKPREMGLGSLELVGLHDARQRALEARQAVGRRQDPLEAKMAASAALKAARAVPTFGELADEYVSTMLAGLKNPKHIDQWKTSLGSAAVNLDRVRNREAHEAHAEALQALRQLRADAVTTEAVVAALKPIWTVTPESASRLRGRIEAVLDAAAARGIRPRTEINPAAWDGHLEALLPPRQRLSRGHHEAMPADAVPPFMARLRAVEGMSARALEFVALTACRSGEVRGARWGEIDLERATWVVPAVRMKAGREHRVPLASAAVALLTRLHVGHPTADALVFPGQSGPLSDMALSMQMRRLGTDAVPHGFRSTFRSWAADAGFPHEVAEQALAHVIPSAVERAYQRSDLFERRRALMEAWAKHCMGPR